MRYLKEGQLASESFSSDLGSSMLGRIINFNSNLLTQSPGINIAIPWFEQALKAGLSDLNSLYIGGLEEPELVRFSPAYVPGSVIDISASQLEKLGFNQVLQVIHSLRPNCNIVDYLGAVIIFDNFIALSLRPLQIPKGFEIYFNETNYYPWIVFPKDNVISRDWDRAIQQYKKLLEQLESVFIRYFEPPTQNVTQTNDYERYAYRYFLKENLLTIFYLISQSSQLLERTMTLFSSDLKEKDREDIEKKAKFLLLSWVVAKAMLYERFERRFQEE